MQTGSQRGWTPVIGYKLNFICESERLGIAHDVGLDRIHPAHIDIICSGLGESIQVDIVFERADRKKFGRQNFDTLLLRILLAAPQHFPTIGTVPA